MMDDETAEKSFLEDGTTWKRHENFFEKRGMMEQLGKSLNHFLKNEE